MDEKAFRKWYARWSGLAGLDPDPDHPLHEYDYRAAYKAGVQPTISEEDGLLHWPSRFKTANHPNRFVGGVDTKAEDMAEPVDSAVAAAPPQTGKRPSAEELRQLLRAANLDRQQGFSEAEVDNNLASKGWGLSYRGLSDSVKALPKQESTTMKAKDVAMLMLSGATLGASESDFFDVLYPEQQERMKRIREDYGGWSKLSELIGSLSTGGLVGGAVKGAVSRTALRSLRKAIPEEIAKSSMHLDALIKARADAARIGTLVGTPVGGAITGAGWSDDRAAGAAVGAGAGTLGAIASGIPGVLPTAIKGGTLLGIMKYLSGK